MLDNEFEQIENFLKSQEKTEMKFLQKFDEEVSQHIKDNFDFSGEKAQENILELHGALSVAYEDFIKDAENTMKNFSISLVLIRNTLEKLNTMKESSPLQGEQKTLYLILMKELIQAIKEDCTMNIDQFKAFLEYIDNFIAPLNLEG